MSFDAWFAIKNIERFRALREAFLDGRSKEVLDFLLLAMLTGNEREYCSFAYDNNQYFSLPLFNNQGEEYYIDAGAYVGDTIEKFIFSQNGEFNHIYAFEPGEIQFNSLQKRINRLISEWALNSDRVSLYNAGLSNITSEAALREGQHLVQTTISFNANGKKVKVYSLDDLEIPVSFLKADIEGSEMDMIHGAMRTLKQYKPKMALSVYHRPDDLFEIFDICKRVSGDYRFAVRHHSPKLVDTTLYCWI
jgi:FkbM family methyltransferase